MARPKKLKPDYCHDKASGRAYVRINGQKKYLGDYGTQTSRDEYAASSASGSPPAAPRR